MKKLGIILLSVLVVALFAIPAFATISGSKHDFTNTGNGRANSTNYQDLVDETSASGGSCAACHVPHNGKTGTDSVLFNTYYNNGTSDVTDEGGYTNQSISNAVSIMCMSCHDGTISVDTSSGMTTDSMDSGANYNLGTDMSNDHPVDVSLSGADGNEGLASKSTITSTNSNIQFYGGSDLVTCGSCHDPHETTDNNKFLEPSTSGNGLCADCHQNK